MEARDSIMMCGNLGTFLISSGLECKRVLHSPDNFASINLQLRKSSLAEKIKAQFISELTNLLVFNKVQCDLFSKIKINSFEKIALLSS